MAKTKTKYTGKKTLVMLECFFCDRPVKTDPDTRAVLCDHCVARLSDAPQQPKPAVDPQVAYQERKARQEARAERKKQSKLAKATKSAGKGRGWHLKKVFEWEGQFYSFGEPITAERAKELSA